MFTVCQKRLLLVSIIAITIVIGVFLLLGRGAQRPIVVKLSRERCVDLSAGASVRASVGLSSAL